MSGILLAHRAASRKAGVTIVVAPQSSTDDGFAYSAGFDTTGGMPLGFGTTGGRGFIRFTSVAIPRGATITSAALVITSFSGTGHGAGTLRAAAVDNSPTPTQSNINSATLTSAGVSYSASSPPAPYSLPDVASVIQEIVSRSGWASGNALTIISVLTSNSPVLTGADMAATLTINYA